MIYDCFTFFNELDLLEIRLNVLNDVVDKFIIVEGTKTHAGIDKGLNFDAERFAKFKDKIIYVVLDEYPPFENSWIYENLQRNYIFNILKDNCKDDDIIIISDLDEIPNPKAIIQYRDKLDGIYALEQNFYYYFLNMQNTTNKKWNFAKIFRYKEFFNEENDKNYSYSEYLPEVINQGLTLCKIRIMHSMPEIKNGGWHFSYLGGIDKIIEKIKNFSHQEYNNEEYLNREKIQKCLENGDDLFKRGYQHRAVKIDKTFPDYIRNNQQRYSDLIFKITPKYQINMFKKELMLLAQSIFSIIIKDNRTIVTIFGIKMKFKTSSNAAAPERERERE